MAKKIKMFQVTLTEQNSDYMFVYYMEGDEFTHAKSTYRFQAIDLDHAAGLLLGTQYKDLKQVR